MSQSRLFLDVVFCDRAIIDKLAAVHRKDLAARRQPNFLFELRFHGVDAVAVLYI